MEMLIKNPELREEMSKKLLNLRKQHTWKERARRIHHALMGSEHALAEKKTP